MPFLDGPTFVARTAARRRHKQGLKTVIHPVTVRYTFDGDFESEFNRLMNPIERILGLPVDSKTVPVSRIERALDALITKKQEDFEVDNAPHTNQWERSWHLADTVLKTAEERWFGAVSEGNITNRIRNIRAQVFPELLERNDLSDDEKQIRWRDLQRTYLAWQMASYPKDYLANGPSKDRILEIAAKIHEDLTDKPRKCGKQRAIIDVCEAIEVTPEKHRGNDPDPLSSKIQKALMDRLNRTADP
jgi:hypothetical protein